MTSDTLIIGYADIKDKTSIPKTVSDTALKPSLEYAHAKLEKILGRTLYAEIQADIDTDATLSGEANILTLVKYYIKPYVAWVACLDFYIEHYGGITKTDIHHKSSDDYDVVPIEVLRMKIQNARNKVDEYQDTLKTFLDTSTVSDYDSYDTTTTGEERIRRTASGGIAPRRNPNRVYEGEARNLHKFYPNDDCCE